MNQMVMNTLLEQRKTKEISYFVFSSFLTDIDPERICTGLSNFCLFFVHLPDKGCLIIDRNSTFRHPSRQVKQE